MKKTIVLVISSLLLAIGCQRDDDPQVKKDGDGVITSKPYLWKTSLHLAEPVSNSGIRAQFYYKNNFLSPITNGSNNRKLAMIDSDNGDILWQWDDRYQPETEDININYYHSYNSLFTYQVGDRSYCIDMDKGTTHWRIRRESSYDGRLYPNDGATYFYLNNSYNDNDHKEQAAIYANILSGDLGDKIRANLSREYIEPALKSIGGVTDINKVPNTTSLYAVTYGEPLPNWEVNSFLGLYNAETGEWVYERKLMAPPTQNTSVFTPPQIYNNKIYANVGHNLVCHDLATGEQCWSRDFTGDFLFSGFIIKEGKLIGSCENEILYCLDPDTGSIIWQTEGAGTSSRLAYLNGVVYFSGGADGKLHAVDTATGETVWRLGAGNVDGSAFAGYNPVYVLPAEGDRPPRVFAHTFGHVVGYEAYK